MSDSIGYDKPHQLMPIAASAGISVPGTAASATVLVRLRVPHSMTIDGATIAIPTGGTAAGPTVAIQKSLGGTGTATNVGTYNVGTAADDASAALTITNTNFVAGDHLLITNLAGTAASTPKVNLLIKWKEEVV